MSSEAVVYEAVEETKVEPTKAEPTRTCRCTRCRGGAPPPARAKPFAPSRRRYLKRKKVGGRLCGASGADIGDEIELSRRQDGDYDQGRLS